MSQELVIREPTTPAKLAAHQVVIPDAIADAGRRPQPLF